MSSRPQSKSDKKTSDKKGKPKSGPKKNYQRAANKNRDSDASSKKVYKITIRDLPSNNFSEANFRDCLSAFIEALQISPDSIDVLHFMEGKLSRKRGPLTGAGFICARDEKSFLTLCQANLADVPFLRGEGEESQPHVCISAYQKKFRGMGRIDKFAGTIVDDADFLSFKGLLEQPVEKLPSAEVLLEAKEKRKALAQAAQEEFVKKETSKLKALANKRDRGRGSASRTEKAVRLAVAANLADKASADAIKINPLLQFMKEKAEKSAAKRNQQVREQARKKSTASGGPKIVTQRERDDTNRQSKVKSNQESMKEKFNKEKDKGRSKDKDKPSKNASSTSNVTPPVSAIATNKPVTVLLKKRPETDSSVPNKEGSSTGSAPKTKVGRGRSDSKKDIPSDSLGPATASEQPQRGKKVGGKGKQQDKKKGTKSNVGHETGNDSIKTQPPASDANKKKKKQQSGKQTTPNVPKNNQSPGLSTGSTIS